MTPRERILAVYPGETPDVVPFMLDLSHWFYHRNHIPWDLSQAYLEPEEELIRYHESIGAGFYVPNLASFYDVVYDEDVHATVRRDDSSGAPIITWRFETPLGAIERSRVWEENTYSWGIREWSLKTEQDINVLAYALSHRTYTPRWERYLAWRDRVGDAGVVYLPLGYSALGHLLSYWSGIEGTMYAVADWSKTMRAAVDQINDNLLQCVDMFADSPAEVIMMGDNISGDIQPPWFFKEWSASFYREATRRLHKAGKFTAVHIDGKLRGALKMVRDTGADCADAVTPTPMGDLTPEQCRAETDSGFILSGGVSPDLWLPSATEEQFRTAVLRWLDLRKVSPGLIANAGDQVPPGAIEGRIELMRDLVEKHGRY